IVRQTCGPRTRTKHYQPVPEFRSKIRWLGLSEEFLDQTLLLLVFDPSKKLCAKPGDCLWFVERHLVVNLASRKMTRLTASLKDRFGLCLEVRLFSTWGESQSRKARCARARTIVFCVSTCSDINSQKHRQQERNGTHAAMLLRWARDSNVSCHFQFDSGSLR